jgi:hypothetical protein
MVNILRSHNLKALIPIDIETKTSIENKSHKSKEAGQVCKKRKNC